MTARPPVYLALGANLGDRVRNIAAALRALEDFSDIEAVSALYETDPVPPDQPTYLNAACRLTTDLDPQALLQRTRQVELELGRRGGTRWGPRPIDIDLLLYGELVLEEGGIAIPHAGLADRPFVLVPLADVGADARHPTLDRSIADLAASADKGGVRLLVGGGWERRWLLSGS